MIISGLGHINEVFSHNSHKKAYRDMLIRNGSPAYEQRHPETVCDTSAAYATDLGIHT